MKLACKDIIFHFNKKHLEDSSIPMWTLKVKGESLYVNHVECHIPWSTKETINSKHTKGSIKIKNALLTIDDSNNAKIVPLTEEDKIELQESQKQKQTRVIWNNYQNDMITSYLKDSRIKHSFIKTFIGECGNIYMVTDIHNKSDLIAMELTHYGKFRILKPNEYYYKAYSNPDYVSPQEARRLRP